MSSTDIEQKAIPSVTWTYSWHEGKETCLHWPQRGNHPDGADVYWLPAESANGKRTKGAIKGSKWVIADWDPPPDVWLKGKGEVTRGALAAWRAAKLAELEAHTPRFTLIVDSGRGFQAGYELTSFGQQEQIEAARYALAGDDGDKCWAVNTVYRLWDTVNSKTGQPTKIIRYEPDNRHHLHELPSDSPPKVYDTDSVTDAVNEGLTLKEDFIQAQPVLAGIIKFGRDIAELTRFGGDATNDHPSACNRSDAIWFVVNELLRLKVPDGDILGLLMNQAHGISNGIYFMRTKGALLPRRNPEDEARRQLAQAKAKFVPETKLITDENGKPLNVFHNFEIVVRPYSVRYDEFTGDVLVSGFDDLGPVLSDVMITRLRSILQATYKGWRPSKEDTRDWLEDIARRNKFHSVRQYLLGLRWDGVPRLDAWLIEAGGAEDNQLTRAFSRLMLMAAVARVFKPGTKFDQMLVLESAQGWDKSSGVEALLPNDRWFTDAVAMGASPKEMIEQMRGKVFGEVAELHGISKADIGRIKTQLSRTTDRARAAYGHFAEDAPRQFVLFGTTNNDRYLRDQTGNRRFWPVTITKRMDLAWIRTWRDQLWAEALALVRPSLEDKHALRRAIMLPEEFWSEAGAEQAKRAESNPFLSTLEFYLDGKVGKIHPELLWRLVDVKAVARNGSNEELLASAMTTLGWTLDRVWFGKAVRTKGWVKGSKADRLRELDIVRPKGSDHWEVFVRPIKSKADPYAPFGHEPESSACH